MGPVIRRRKDRSEPYADPGPRHVFRVRSRPFGAPKFPLSVFPARFSPPPPGATPFRSSARAFARILPRAGGGFAGASRRAKETGGGAPTGDASRPFSAPGKKVGCNTRTSQEVTHPSTTLAQARLTAEF